MRDYHMPEVGEMWNVGYMALAQEPIGGEDGVSHVDRYVAIGIRPTYKYSHLSSR